MGKYLLAFVFGIIFLILSVRVGFGIGPNELPHGVMNGRGGDGTLQYDDLSALGFNIVREGLNDNSHQNDSLESLGINLIFNGARWNGQNINEERWAIYSARSYAVWEAEWTSESGVSDTLWHNDSCTDCYYDGDYFVVPETFSGNAIYGPYSYLRIHSYLHDYRNPHGNAQDSLTAEFTLKIDSIGFLEDEVCSLDVRIDNYDIIIADTILTVADFVDTLADPDTLYDSIMVPLQFDFFADTFSVWDMARMEYRVFSKGKRKLYIDKIRMWDDLGKKIWDRDAQTIQDLVASMDTSWGNHPNTINFYTLDEPTYNNYRVDYVIDSLLEETLGIRTITALPGIRGDMIKFAMPENYDILDSIKVDEFNRRIPLFVDSGAVIAHWFSAFIDSVLPLYDDEWYCEEPAGGMDPEKRVRILIRRAQGHPTNLIKLPEYLPTSLSDSMKSYIESLGSPKIAPPIDGDNSRGKSAGISLWNYPNAFNSSTEIKYYLPQEAEIKLEVFNLLGRKVDILYEGKKSKGYHIINWKAKDLPSGIYFCKLTSAGKSVIKKMTLLK